jgi:hypothetical protein
MSGSTNIGSLSRLNRNQSTHTPVRLYGDSHIRILLRQMQLYPFIAVM